MKTGKLVSATGSGGRSCVTRRDCANVAAAALLHSTVKAICNVTDPASVTHEQVASLLSRVSGKRIEHVNVSPEEVEKGLAAAGIPQFAARSVRELDEAAACGYQAILRPAVKDLTGQDPTPLEDFLQVTIPAMIAYSVLR